jgi:hypothetical protein
MDNQETYSLPQVKKIWATVTYSVFDRFLRRCRQEKIDLDDAFAGLVKMYGDGGMITFPKHEKATVKCQYAQDHQNERQ